MSLLSNLAFAVSDVNEFFILPDMTQAKISPDGEFIATIRYRENRQVITLFKTSSQSESVLLDQKYFSQQKGEINRLEWIDNRHIAAQFSEIRKGIDGLLDRKKAHSLLVISRPEAVGQAAKVYSVRTEGWLVHPLAQQSNYLLYAKSGAYSKVYKIDVSKLSLYGEKLNKLSKVDGGQFKQSNEVISVKGYAVRWFINHEGEPKAVLNLVDRKELALTVFDEKEDSRVLSRWKFNEQSEQGKNLLPIALTDDPQSFYCLDLAEPEQRTVYRVNYADNTEQVVYEANSFKIIALILSEDDNTFLGVKVIKNGRIAEIFLNNDQVLLSAAGLSDKPGLVAKVSESTDKAKAIFYIESHDNPGQFLLKQKSKDKAAILGGLFPRLSGKLQSRLIESSLDVQGLTIPYLLTLPDAESTRVKYPLIVMPHGGPIGVHDDVYYDQVSQFLVAQGYAVLRVNFRGSSGYSPELKAAGKLEWGKGMLTDIELVTKQVLKRKDIDAKKVCSFGMSYGGYAALMLTINQPQIYKCAINWAGVTDINLHLNAGGRTKAQQQWLLEHVGDSKTDYQALKQLSPAYLADKITTPVFIAHGAQDAVVDVEHAYRIKLMLDKHGKNYRWFLDPQGSHSFGDVEQKKSFFTALAGFIDANIH